MRKGRRTHLSAAAAAVRLACTCYFRVPSHLAWLSLLIRPAPAGQRCTHRAPPAPPPAQLPAHPPAGQCLLEWEGEGAPPLPLLKDMFASERRKAKVLNFSIAYGKTAHGLSKDWKVTVEEATATVERWYADRPEVRRGGVGMFVKEEWAPCCRC